MGEVSVGMLTASLVTVVTTGSSLVTMVTVVGCLRSMVELGRGLRVPIVSLEGWFGRRGSERCKLNVVAF